MRGNREKIAIYSRKSKFTGKGESIGNQVELCRECVRNTYGAAAAEQCIVFEDEGFSGGNLNRPSFQKMMEGVRQRKFRAIVVYRLDRISRNINDFAGLIDELTKLDVSFVSIREQFDTGTPMGRAMMFIISVFSQLERETIAERIRDNMHELAKTGRWLGGITPMGFRSGAISKVTVDGKERKSFQLIPIAEEIEIPKLIFELYIKTDSLTAVEAELLCRRIKTRQDKNFTRFAIKGILQNPVYMIADGAAYDYFTERQADVCFSRDAFDGSRGIMAYNRTEQEKGKTTVLLPVSKWIVALGQHSGIIPSNQWIDVQLSLERNKSKSYRKSRNNEALLTGLLFCTCGERMYPKLSCRETAEGTRVSAYVCKMKERSKRQRCNSRNVNGNLLDDAMIQMIRTLKEDARLFATQLEQSRKFYAVSRTDRDHQRERLRTEYASNEKIINGLIDSMAMAGESVARPRILKRIEELEQSGREIAKRIRELEDLSLGHSLSGQEFDMFCRRLSMLHTSIDGMSVEGKRAAIRSVIRRVIWDGENAHVVLFGTDEGEIAYPETDQMPSTSSDSGAKNAG